MIIITFVFTTSVLGFAYVMYRKVQRLEKLQRGLKARLDLLLNPTDEKVIYLD